MEHFIIRGSIIADPASAWNGQQADIRIHGGLIAEVARNIPAQGIPEVDFSDAILMPGWVDSGSFLQSPGHEERETTSRFLEGAADAGFTDVITHLHTEPSADSAELITMLSQQAEKSPVSIHLLANLTKGKQGKALSHLYEMAQAGAYGFSDGNTDIDDSGLLLRALQYNSSFGTHIFVCPVDRALAAGLHVYEGELSARMGLKGIPVFSETLRIRRDIELAEYTGGTLVFTGITTLEGLIAASRKHTCVLWLPHLVISHEDWITFPSDKKVFPPIPPAGEAAQMVNAILQNEHILLATAHHALSREDVDHDFLDAGSGISAYPEGGMMLFNLLVSQGADYGSIAEVLAIRPRKQLGLPQVRIADGGGADLTIVQPDGVTVHSGRYPNSGYRTGIKGKVQATIHQGKLRYCCA